MNIKINKKRKGSELMYFTYEDLGKHEIVECPECKMEYAPTLEGDAQRHRERHEYIDGITTKHGFFILYEERERIKKVARKTLADSNSSLSERQVAAINLLKCYFARSIESLEIYYQLHVDFDTYVAMMLNNKDIFCKDVELYHSLVKKYGKKKGIKKGMSYYDPPA
jgi:hypothetical protein